MIETATYIGLVDFSKLINRTVYAPMLRHFGTTNTVPKCLVRDTSAPVPKCLKFFRWCRSVHETLLPKCPRDTSAPVPKCLGSEVSVHHLLHKPHKTDYTCNLRPLIILSLTVKTDHYNFINRLLFKDIN